MEHASLNRRKRSGWSAFGRTNISGESGRVHTRGRGLSACLVEPRLLARVATCRRGCKAIVTRCYCRYGSKAGGTGMARPAFVPPPSSETEYEKSRLDRADGGRASSAGGCIALAARYLY